MLNYGLSQSDPMTTSTRSPVRHNQRLDHDQLLTEARNAFGISGLTRQKLAENLGVTGAAVGQALSHSGGRYAELQRRIIEAFTAFRIERVAPEYRVIHKEHGE